MWNNEKSTIFKEHIRYHLTDRKRTKNRMAVIRFIPDTLFLVSDTQLNSKRFIRVIYNEILASSY